MNHDLIARGICEEWQYADEGKRRSITESLAGFPLYDAISIAIAVGRLVESGKSTCIQTYMRNTAYYKQSAADWATRHKGEDRKS